MNKDLKLFSFCERQFEPKETMRQIIHDTKSVQAVTTEWNIDPRISVLCNEEENVPDGMVFKMNHKNYSDMVMITLAWNDTYTIRFINEEAEVTHKIDEVYCDQLFEVLDRYFRFGHLLTNFHMN